AAFTVVFRQADHISFRIVAGVAGRGQYHTQRRTRVPLGSFTVQFAVQRGQAMRHQIRLHTQHNWLSFRVTETAVVFDHFRVAGGVDHQAGVEETGVIVAFGGHTVNGRHNHFAHHAVVNVLGDHRGRGIGTHTAGVRAGVFVTDAL